jgi:hypothetical protein
MQSPLLKFLNALRQFPFEAFTQRGKYFTNPSKDFTRRRSLFLERLCWLQIGLLKKSQSVELDSFFDQLYLDELPSTKSALCQSRQKIKPVFFSDFFWRTVDAFYQHFKFKTWKGFKVWATDGTGFRLPDAPELGDTFGWHENQHLTVPSARLICCFDVLNKVVTRLVFHARTTAEIVIASRHIRDIPKDVLMIYDRGFASQLIPFLHLHFGSHCIVRLPLERSKTVISFIKSGKKQTIVTELLQQRAKKALQALDIDVNIQTTVTYRLIRVELQTSETEVLLTTLTDKKRYGYQHFANLYHKRWGIETAFFVIKSYFQLAGFSSIKPNLCWAEIFSHFILYNIQTASFKPLNKKIKVINKRRVHDYQPNRNVSAGLLKRYLIRWFLGDQTELEQHINAYHARILRTLEPIRPGKTKERKRRLMRGTERHSHEKNYRRAF